MVPLINSITKEYKQEIDSFYPPAPTSLNCKVTAESLAMF